MNVGSTVLSQAGTAVDVLQKAARIKVDNGGGISVLGVGNALIVVDGRLLPSNQVLESIPSSDIQKIDIITNPSAKYDASGKAVIEITTKKAKDNGWGGEFTSRIAKGKNWRKYIGTEISGKINDLSVFASYALVPEKRTWNEEYERIYPQEIKILNNIETHTKVLNNHNFRLATDYNLSNEHTVGAQFSVSIRNTEKDVLNFNKLINDQVVSDILSDQDGQLNRKYLSGTAFYSFNPKSEKVKLDILFDKSNFSTDEKVNIKENNLSKYNDIRTDININSIKTDIQLHLTNTVRLDLGGKFSQIRNNSTTGFYVDSKQNNFLNYNYKENIWAVYAILSIQKSQLSVNGGLRAELSDNFARSNEDIIQDNKQQFNLFPNASIGYKISESFEISTSYAMKISRPTFQDMNPAINYIDSLSYFQGNPELIPEIQHAIGLKFIYKTYVSLAFNYTKKNNMLGWYIEQDKLNPLVTKATQKNIDKSDIYSIDLTLPYQKRSISGYLATGVIITNSNDKMTNIVNLSKPMWYAYSGLNFNLPYDIKFGSNIRYFTKGVENIFYFDPVFRMDMSLQKNFLDNKLVTTVSWNDIFKTDKMNTYTTLDHRFIGYNYDFDQSYIQLAITYRFRSSKTKYKSRSSISSEESRIKGL